MPTSPLPEDRIPVIVGVGEIVDRPKDIAAGLEPLALLVEALKRAEADSGAQWLAEIQSLDIVNFLSWRYQDPARQLSDRLGIKPAHAYYGPVGGESPIRYLHEAAQRIARGECSVAAVCGAEAQSTATKAERAGNDGDLIAAIVGHKRSGMTLGRYSEGPEMEKARRCVASVRLPPLDQGPVKEQRALRG